MNSEIKETLNKNFPFFNESEQLLIKDLLFRKSLTPEKFEASKKSFLELLHKDLCEFYRWDNSQEDRVLLRRRFLNVSGLFIIIPIQELRELALNARKNLKKIVYESPPSPLDQNLLEIHSYDLKYMPLFERFFSKIKLEPDITAQDYVAGNREKRIHPPTQFTVFRKNLKDEIISAEYVTASSEPLTQTQLISLYNPDGTLRDMLTVGFDIVYESAFIDLFFSAPQVSPITLPRNAHLMGLHFVKSAVNDCFRHQHRTDFLKEYPLFLEPSSKPEQVSQLLQMMMGQFIPRVKEKIREWNKTLKIDLENEQFYWGEETQGAAQE